MYYLIVIFNSEWSMGILGLLFYFLERTFQSTKLVKFLYIYTFWKKI